MNIRVMLDFPSPAEAISVLQRLSGVVVVAAARDIDNPAFGADVMAVQQAGGLVSVPLPPAPPVIAAAPPAPAAPNLATVGFGQGVTLPAGATPAPASAVAAPSATVPVAPSGTTAVPPAPTVPAQQPAAAAAAPTAPAAPTTPVPGVELDKEGLPWDARIHAKTKTKNQDGTWRQRRELDPAVKATVEAELRAVLAANASAVGAAVAPAAAPAQSAVPLPPATVAAAAVPQPPSPAPATAAAPTASPSEWTFPGLMEAVSPHMMVGVITQQHMIAALKEHGLSAVGQLALAPAVTQHVAAALGKIVDLGVAK